MTTRFSGIRLEDIGDRQTNWNTRKVKRCEHVFDGEKVVVHLGKGKTVRATVACAAGHHCRVITENGLDTWVHVHDCAREPPTRFDRIDEDSGI